PTLNSSSDELRGRHGCRRRRTRPRGDPRRTAGAGRDHPRDPAGRGHRPARAERERKDDAHAVGGGRPGRRVGSDHRARAPCRRSGAAAPDRLPDAGAEHLRRPHRRRERPLLRGAVRRLPGGRGRSSLRRRPGAAGPPARGDALRRSAQPGLARLRPGRSPGAPRPGRADHRPGPGAARRAVGPLPGAGRRRCHGHRLEPRHGRGQPLRPAHPRPGGTGRRRRHPRGRQGPRRDRGPRRGVPHPHQDRGGGVMSARLLAGTTRRILRQLQHDHRSAALVLIMPVVLLTLVYFMWEDQPQFDRITLVLLGVFPLTIMFLLTNISVLRERTTGTLERLVTPPITKRDVLFAYGAAFGLAPALQAAVAGAYAHWVLGMAAPGGLGLVILIAFANALL